MVWRCARSAMQELVSTRPVMVNGHCPENGARPAAVAESGCLGNQRRTVPMHSRVRIQTIVRIEIGPPARCDDVRVRRPVDSPRVRIELRLPIVRERIMLARLASIERRTLALDRVR